MAGARVQSLSIPSFCSQATTITGVYTKLRAESHTARCTSSIQDVKIVSRPDYPAAIHQELIGWHRENEGASKHLREFHKFNDTNYYTWMIFIFSSHTNYVRSEGIVFKKNASGAYCITCKAWRIFISMFREFLFLIV